MKIHGPAFSKHFAPVAAFVIVLSVGLGCNFVSDDQWKSALSGKKLTRASTSGSFSDKITLYFCSNGDYGKQTDSTGFSPGGAGSLSMASNDVEYGRWKVDSSVLVLESQKGETFSYELGRGNDDNVIVIGGNGYLVTTQNECEN
jgi:hypothetical protein